MKFINKSQNIHFQKSSIIDSGDQDFASVGTYFASKDIDTSLRNVASVVSRNDLLAPLKCDTNNLEALTLDNRL